MLSRRQLLKRSLLVSLAPVVPTFLARSARAAQPGKDRRVLVVVQMDGGNDGLNTVVPYRDEHYARLRPKLLQPVDELLKLNDDLALHPAMKGAARLFESGRLAIVQGVGYPNPNRSHFRSMAIWQTARLDETDHGQTGWLGKALDVRAQAQDAPHAIFTGTGPLPLSLWSRRSTSISVRSREELALDAPADLLHFATQGTGDETDLARFVAGASRDAFATSERLTTALAHEDGAGGGAYRNTRLAQQLKIVSALIKSDTNARVFYATQAGYDTHASQLYVHRDLLAEFSDALTAFLDDLAASGLAERVLVLAFSEFGRRAAENASEGTDHGAAAPVFLAGTKLASPIVGPTPDLSQLVDGDVKMAIDFRQLYATILERWLDIAQAEVLTPAFEPLSLLKA